MGVKEHVSALSLGNGGRKEAEGVPFPAFAFRASESMRAGREHGGLDDSAHATSAKCHWDRRIFITFHLSFCLFVRARFEWIRCYVRYPIARNN